MRRVVSIRIARIGAFSVSEVWRRGGSGGPGSFAAGRAELATEALRAERPQRQTDGLPEADQQVVELRPKLSAKERKKQNSPLVSLTNTTRSSSAKRTSELLCITIPRKPKLELFARVLRLARRAPRPAESVRDSVHVCVHRDASRLLPRDLN